MGFDYLPQFFYNQFAVTPPKPTRDCTGRTVIITGANTGLGKEAARHYVRLNAEKVIIACRSAEKGEAAKQDIEQSTGRQGAIEVWPLDLASYESVKQFAKRVNTLPRVDIIIENAGIHTVNYSMAEDNESTITVNVVSTFLLALLVIPKLRETATKYNILPTLTIVSSEVHHFTSFPERQASSIFSTLNSKEEARMSDRYNVSKFLEVVSIREIVKENPRLGEQLTLNFVNPGWCHSELAREFSNPIIKFIQLILCRTTEVGSRTLVDAGLRGQESHGKYLSNCQVSNCSVLVEGPEGPEIQKRVWGELREKLETIEPGVTKVLSG
ncbi:hypothetical protein AC578_6033 [Pseudocercospora eumusae]|uniref:NAD(P)-binding protein n=1 Tax=Pseudocercospora eumusae TaxID=321146 RepID=A0A139HVI0_9PEZI|nr:hypothetical protein AC578_6033 [Pseudocercospora eumusae]